MEGPNTPILPIKDGDAAHPVPSAWRPILSDIVKAFVQGDYTLERGINSVAPVSAATADHIAEYIADYGETLIELPEKTWETSISMWAGGSLWDAIVDLWTAESGESDMILHARVTETESGYNFEIHLVYVP